MRGARGQRSRSGVPSAHLEVNDGCRRDLRARGTRVATIKPDATVVDLLRGLRDEGIGAMVVSDDGYHLDGIVSERDVVRALARVGAGSCSSRSPRS